MDSTAQLALMVKAKKVFENERTFLSFPITPLPFTKQQLSFMSDQNLHNLQTFSLLVNMLPSGEAWLPSEEQSLWDAYGYVLRGTDTDIAESLRTPEEEEDYQQALHYLYHINDDGSRAESDDLLVYKQYRDKWFILRQSYNDARSTGETSTDPAIKVYWETVEEPRLRAEIMFIETLWETQGHKVDIEEAQARVAELGAKSPRITWNEWRGMFNPDIDALTDLNGISFYPSCFTPANALEEGAWQTFSLCGDEVRALVEQASPDLRSRLSVNSGASEIASLSFEFSSVAIVRPWFVPNVFSARFWRLNDSSTLLSDGGDPPSGFCTAYVTAVVFSRNVKIKAASAPPGNSGIVPPKVIHFPIIDFIKGPLPAREPLRIPFKRPMVNPRFAQPKPIRELRIVPVDTRKKIAVSRAFAGLNRAAFNRLKVSVGKGTVVGKPASTETPQEDNTIHILAFICKELPRCPNPDPALQW